MTEHETPKKEARVDGQPDSDVALPQGTDGADSHVHDFNRWNVVRRQWMCLCGACRATANDAQIQELQARLTATEQERDALKAHAMPDGLKCIDLGECLAQHEQIEYFEHKLKEAEQEIARLREGIARHLRECHQHWCTCGLAALLAPQEP